MSVHVQETVKRFYCPQCGAKYGSLHRPVSYYDEQGKISSRYVENCGETK